VLEVDAAVVVVSGIVEDVSGEVVVTDDGVEQAASRTIIRVRRFVIQRR
jgi:hypothetical protein